MLKHVALIAFILGSIIANNAYASEKSIAAQYAKIAAPLCIDRWEDAKCHAAIAESNKALAGNFAQELQDNGKSQSIELIKQNCAAATAPSEKEYPAYAVQSAFTECANIFFDIANETGIKPDPSHYQLLVGTVLCMSKDPRCSAVEAGLSRFK
ncbi:MAG: hypothetical protein KTR28_05555 [Micavibrio sp.]|nr:hypothetical protein [Micavibrio sp.]